MPRRGWRILMAAGVVAGLTVGARTVAGQSAGAPDVLGQLLTEVRGLRTAMEQMASAGPRVQLALGRLQLQEQRVNNLLRRMETLRGSLQTAQQQQEQHVQQIKQFEDAVRAGGEDREEAEGLALQFKGQLGRVQAEIQRLQAEEAALQTEITTEQARWSGINQRLEELERSLDRR